MKTKIKAIIFDMGGVITEGRSSDIYSHIGKGLKLDPKKIKHIMRKHYPPLEVGKISILEFAQNVCKDLKYNNPKKLIKLWIEKIYSFRTNKAVWDIAKTLKKKYKVALVSNVFEDHYRIHKSKGRYRIFNPVICSHQVGLRKPDAAIFKLALKKLKVKPQEAIFIDDRLKFIRGAKKLEINTIWFKNAVQLKRKLNFILGPVV